MFNVGHAVVLRHPKRDVPCCAIAKGQSLVATGCLDGVVRLWEASDGALLLELSGPHKGMVTGVSFNADATSLASCAEDNTLVLWDLTSLVKGVRFRLLDGHGAPLLCCVFAPNSSLLATGSKDCDVMLWGALGRPVTRRLRGHSNWVLCAAFSSNSTLLLTGGHDHAICVWNCETFAIKQTMRHHESAVTCVAISSEGSVVLSGDDDGKVALTRLSDGAVLRWFKGHRDGVRCVTFVESFGLVLSGSRDMSIKVWTLRGRCVRSLKGHDGAVLNIHVNTDQDFYCSCGDDFTARVVPFRFTEEQYD
jgi:WD40 repeat protein